MARALQPDMEELLRTVRNTDVEYKRRFLIQFGEKIRKVQIGEVAYFHALEKVRIPHYHRTAVLSGGVHP